MGGSWTGQNHLTKNPIVVEKRIDSHTLSLAEILCLL